LDNEPPNINLSYTMVHQIGRTISVLDTLSVYWLQIYHSCSTTGCDPSNQSSVNEVIIILMVEKLTADIQEQKITTCKTTYMQILPQKNMPYLCHIRIIQLYVQLQEGIDLHQVECTMYQGRNV